MRNVKKTLTLLALSMLVSTANANFRYSFPLHDNLPVTGNNNSSGDGGQESNGGNGGNEPDDGSSDWSESTPIYTNIEYGTIYNCATWTPMPTEFQGEEQEVGDHDFYQTGTNCSMNVEKLKQKKLFNASTGEYKDDGEPVLETETQTGINGTRLYGQKLFSWWATNGDDALYDCATYSPEANTVRAGDEFQQAVTNCTESMSRGGMGYYWDNKLGWIEDPENPYQTFTKLVYGVDRTISAWGTREWVEGDW